MPNSVLSSYKIAVSERHQFFFVARPKMNWCFHCRWHKHDTNQYISFLIKYIRPETLSTCGIIRDLHIVEMQPYPFKMIFQYLAPVCKSSGNAHTHHSAHVSMCSPRHGLMPLLRIRCWVLISALHTTSPLLNRIWIQLLRSAFLHFSSTWCLPFQWNENGCGRT